MPLSMVDVGTDHLVRRINGRSAVHKRLEELGIVPGTIVHVVSKNATGIIVNVKESRLALGLDLATKVLV